MWSIMRTCIENSRCAFQCWRIWNTHRNRNYCQSFPVPRIFPYKPIQILVAMLQILVVMLQCSSRLHKNSLEDDPLLYCRPWYKKQRSHARWRVHSPRDELSGSLEDWSGDKTDSPMAALRACQSEHTTPEAYPDGLSTNEKEIKSSVIDET